MLADRRSKEFIDGLHYFFECGRGKQEEQAHLRRLEEQLLSNDARMADEVKR
jgi:hypothetical protein